MVTISNGFSIAAVVLLIGCFVIILNSKRFSEKAFEYSLKLCGGLVMVCIIVALATSGIKEGYRHADGQKSIQSIDMDNLTEYDSDITNKNSQHIRQTTCNCPKNIKHHGCLCNNP
jgi:hypothetical protein